MPLPQAEYYTGIVISNEIDPHHAGAVRIRVDGVTGKGYEPEQQPFARPMESSSQMVPKKGMKLRVIFEGGDINQPRYYPPTPTKETLAQEYIDGYPNVSVTNLGAEGYVSVTNSVEQRTVIYHPSTASITIDGSAGITINNEKAHHNTGYGAKDENGIQVHPVLTEATIDIFTCRPVGNGGSLGGTYQGSEYLSVTHMSRDTHSRLNGGGVDLSEVGSVSEDGVDDLGDGPGSKRDIYTMDGDLSDTVEYIQSPSNIIRSDENTKETCSTVIITMSGNDDFVKTTNRARKSGGNYSAHFVVGKHNSAPEENAADPGVDSSGGVVQMVELTDDATIGNTIEKEGDAEKLNRDAVSIVLVGEDGSEPTQTQFQWIDKIISTVAFTFDLSTLNVVVVSNATNVDMLKVIYTKNGLGSAVFMGGGK